MIDVHGLVKRYGNNAALRGVSFRVEAGELYAWLGPNGSGKTTTIRILTGLTRPDEGRVMTNGHDMLGDPVSAKRQNGLVPQTVNLDAELSVRENLDIHGRLFGMTRSHRKSRIDGLLEYVELAERANSRVKELSGGQKRRVMIARALMHRPRTLFLDEPTVGLDPAIRRRIWSLIRTIRDDGVSIFLTTHYIEEAEAIADRVAFLDKGSVVAEGTPAELMARLGEWIVETAGHGETQSSSYATREEAQAAVARATGTVTLRRVCLEDVFLAVTGRKAAS